MQNANNLLLCFHVLVGAFCIGLELWFIRKRTAPPGACQKCFAQHFWNRLLYKAVVFCRTKIVRIPLIGARLAEMDKVVLLMAALLLLKRAMKDGENDNAQPYPYTRSGPGTNANAGTNVNANPGTNANSGPGPGTNAGTSSGDA